MEISVRNATISDYQALCELLDEIDALHRDHLPQPDGDRLLRKTGLSVFEPENEQRAKEFSEGTMSHERIHHSSNDRKSENRAATQEAV